MNSCNSRDLQKHKGISTCYNSYGCRRALIAIACKLLEVVAVHARVKNWLMKSYMGRPHNWHYFTAVNIFQIYFGKSVSAPKLMS